jgi:hypothetical protein
MLDLDGKLKELEKDVNIIMITIWRNQGFMLNIVRTKGRIKEKQKSRHE